MFGNHQWQGMNSRLVIRERWHFAVFKISFLLRSFRVDLQQWQNPDEKVLLSMHAGFFFFFFCYCVCVCVFVNRDDLYFYSPNLFVIACSYQMKLACLYLLGIVNEWQENNCRPIDCGLRVILMFSMPSQITSKGVRFAW